MKSIQLLGTITFSIITLFSCSKEKEFDVEANVAQQEMNSEKALDVKVVNELDPICGMTTADHLNDTVTYQGKTYGFCNTLCKEEFLKDPEKHIHE